MPTIEYAAEASERRLDTPVDELSFAEVSSVPVGPLQEDAGAPLAPDAGGAVAARVGPLDLGCVYVAPRGAAGPPAVGGT